MLSHPLGIIDLDESRLAPEITTLLQCNSPNESYSEFKIGNWRTVVLWNASGSNDDGLIADNKGQIKPTPRAKTLNYINELIAQIFNLDQLRLVRAHILEDGVMIPHRDYVELKDGGRQWCRIHLPILTNDYCFHSEEKNVFRMRRGEIWMLNAAKTHSACNLGQSPRIILCLDFDLAGEKISSIFRDTKRLGRTEPILVEREPLQNDFLESLYGLSRLINRTNYREILNFLARVHFYKDVDINDFFVWMVEIARRANDKLLVEKFTRFATFLHSSREMEERFIL